MPGNAGESFVTSARVQTRWRASLAATFVAAAVLVRRRDA